MKKGKELRPWSTGEYEVTGLVLTLVEQAKAAMHNRFSITYFTHAPLFNPISALAHADYWQQQLPLTSIPLHSVHTFWLDHLYLAGGQSWLFLGGGFVRVAEPLLILWDLITFLHVTISWYRLLKFISFAEMVAQNTVKHQSYESMHTILDFNFIISVLYLCKTSMLVLTCAVCLISVFNLIDSNC